MSQISDTPSYGSVLFFNTERGFGKLRPSDKNGKLLTKDKKDSVFFHISAYSEIEGGSIPGTVDWMMWEGARYTIVPEKGDVIVYEARVSDKGPRASLWAPEEEYRLELAKVTYEELRVVDETGAEVWMGRYSERCDMLFFRGYGEAPRVLPKGAHMERYILGEGAHWQRIQNPDQTLALLTKAAVNREHQRI